MAGFFRNLGRKTAPGIRKGKWYWHSLTGDEDLLVKAEEGVGRDLARALAADLPPDPDPEVQRFVSEVGAHLVNCVKDKRREFRFAVVASGDPNALALPGGYVFITRSLLDLIGDQVGEVAFVLGHEMGHVLGKHAMGRAMTDSSIATVVKALPGGNVARSLLKSAASKLLTSAHSQEREWVADRYGVTLMRASGFDPEDSMRLLQRLEESVASSSENLGVCEYFSSHPPFERRISEIGRVLEGKGG